MSVTGPGCAACNFTGATLFDATDAAHPAWWRGNDAGCRGALSLVARLRAEVDALKAPIARRVAPSVAVDVGDDGDLVVVTRSEAEAFAAAHPYAAGAIMGGVAIAGDGLPMPFAQTCGACGAPWEAGAVDCRPCAAAAGRSVVEATK